MRSAPLFLPHCLFILLVVGPFSSVMAQSERKTTRVAKARKGRKAVAVNIPKKDGAAKGAPASGDYGCANGYSGFVKSAGKALAGANVFVEGTNITLATNGEGFFVLPPSVRERPMLRVSAMGYESAVLDYQGCEPVTLEMRVLPDTRFKKHGRRKGFILIPRRVR